MRMLQALMLAVLMLAFGPSHAGVTLVSHDGSCIFNGIIDPAGVVRDEPHPCPNTLSVQIILPDGWVPGSYFGFGSAGNQISPFINIGGILAMELAIDGPWFFNWSEGPDGVSLVEFGSGGQALVWYTNEWISESPGCDDNGCWPGFLHFQYSLGTLRRVPEPGTLALLGIGLAGLGFARRRK